ncbi:MAG: Gfo/Idh/MocA family protein [Bryobacteraceae bacterium]
MQQGRRAFMTSALASAPLIVPRAAWGANDRVAFGLIGAGGRGRYLANTFQKLGTQCVAIAEVYERNAEAALKIAPQAKTFVEYRELLQQPGIDCVVVGTPDHQHCPVLLAALAAKKDVYLEKPMSHSLEESQKMIKAVRASKQIVQIGMQRRSAPSVIKGKEIITSGRLGRISMVKPMWNWNISKPLDNSPLPGKLDWQRFVGPAKDRKFEPMVFRSWRYFWNFSGGNMTDQGTHLMDVVQWYMGVNAATSAVCWGQKIKNTGSEVPDAFCAVFEYPQFMATWTLNYCNSYDNDWSIQFQGDEGTMILSNAGFSIWKEPWPKNREPIEKLDAPVPLETHVQNFLDCMKSRQEPNAPVEVGASAVSAPHLANLAFHSGRRAFMPKLA